MQRLFDIKKTQIEIASDRGYIIPAPEQEILNMTLEDFTRYLATTVDQMKTSPRAALSRTYLSRETFDGAHRGLLVYYGGKTSPQQKQVSADVIRSFIGVIHKYGIYEAILIVDAPISSTGNEELSALKLTKWQVFHDSDLTYNPTRHVDVPRHVRLPREEASAKLIEMRTDISKLPLIRITDPIAKYYGWSVGDLIQIHRDDSSVSILAPKSINYRVVVD
jgi:DNA-directed RNA polymerase I, II, and III subunit RPABC1